MALVDEIILRDNASLENKLVDESKKIKNFGLLDWWKRRWRYAYLRFSKNWPVCLVFLPKIDSTYDANLSFFSYILQTRGIQINLNK